MGRPEPLTIAYVLSDWGIKYLSNGAPGHKDHFFYAYTVWRLGLELDKMVESNNDVLQESTESWSFKTYGEAAKWIESQIGAKL